MAGMNTTLTKFSYATSAEGEYKEILHCQEIPSLGGTVEKIDVTCLGDTNKKYINGLVDYGELTFKFLYDNSSEESNYRTLRNLDGEHYFRVELKDGTKFEFSGEITTALDAIAAGNNAIYFTATVALSSEITTIDPV